jgi:poly-gamma-glutamate capsule biosynthesis protein CapA/YwtB (metallophosphatase superfamily)
VEMDRSISVMATGDSFITQRLPRDDQGLQALRRLLMRAHVRFTNLEVTVHDFEVFPSAVSGGTWAAARPPVLADLRWLGFNMLAWANNHTLDWSYGGLQKTYEHLERGRWVHAGVGLHLAEASQPRYLETSRGRVALIAATSTCRDWHVAGPQRPDLPGRPGVNPLRFKTVHHIPPEDLERLQQIIARTDINAARILSEKEGFSTAEEGVVHVGEMKFAAGHEGTVTTMDADDGERLGRSIREAVRQADVVLVSHHAHEMKGTDKSVPADFIRDFAHFCIDQGAHAYIGHGPHILRGVEIYRNRPIFYSLGDFIFQNDTVERQPQEFYQAYGLGPDSTPADAFDARERAGLAALAKDPKVFQTVIPEFDICAGEVRQIVLHPVTLGFGRPRSQRGRPAPASVTEGEQILAHLRDLSQPYGTQIDVTGGVGIVRL